ncbi:MAG: hypothetical protein Q4P65_00045 [Eubacteriales bacterium]|nr:hypothetical protein [Eubacteriales bacterium]
MKKLTLVLMLIAFVGLFSACEEIRKESIKEEVGCDLIPMVQIDGHLYQDTGFVNSAVTCGTADGEIKTSVSQQEKPMQDDESNFGTGFEYQLMDKIHVNVFLKDRWIIFKSIAVSNDEIPESVANFKAEVIDSEDSTLLLRITEVPDLFKYLFKDKDLDQFKPIRVGTDNLVIYSHQDVKKDELVGKLVQVWFDGQVENADAKSSSPMELGDVYRISLVD